MPSIGRPIDPSQSQFAEIKINKSPAAAPGTSSGAANDPTKARAVGDSLNQIAGNKPESRFVDRKKHEELGQDGFMKLLAHQLKNQDPMKPMDQKDFSANLAQFSQLEQLTAMNKKMDSVNQNALDDKRVQGAAFLGRKVVTSGTSIDYAGDGKDAKIPFYLDQYAKNAVINVLDNKNQLVARIEKENLHPGMQDVTWNGIGFDGQVAAKETYHFEIIGFDENNNKFAGSTRAEGIVQGVHFEDGETVLDLANGKKVFVKNVQSFSVAENLDPGKNAPALQKQAAAAYNNVEKQ
jgi:flagellar basal-body rod modification protein FlgD